MHIRAYIYAYSIENMRLRSPLHTVRPPGGRCGVRNTPATYFKHCYRLQEYVLDDYCRSKAPPPALLTAYMCGVTIPAGLFRCPLVSLCRVTALLDCHMVCLPTPFSANTIQRKQSTTYGTAEPCARKKSRHVPVGRREHTCNHSLTGALSDELL